jgi:ATP-binding cassette subfamily B protein
MSDATAAGGTPGAAAVLGRPRRDYSMFDAELSGQVFNLRLLRRLLHWLRPHRMRIAVSAVLVLLSATLRVLLPMITSIVVVDHLLIHGERAAQMPDFGLIDLTDWLTSLSGWHPLAVACVLFSVLTLLEAVTGHWHRMTLTSSIVAGLRDLRHDLFRHLETRPASFFDRVAVGRVMTRVTNDVEALYEMLRGMGTLVGEFVPFFVALIVMFAVSPEITLCLLLAVPVLAVVTHYFRERTRYLFRMVRMTVSQLNQNMQENLAGLLVVQISGRQQFNLDRYQRINRENRGFETRSMRVETYYGAFTDSLAHVAIALIVYFGGGSAVQGSVTLGGVYLFTRFIDMLFHPVIEFGQQMNVMFRAMASGERIFQALDWDEAVHEPAEPATLPRRLAGEVRFERLSFAYDADVPVLQDVTFTIRPGEKLAIVGPTGSGKSTIIRLLGRFYDFPDGMIFLDGIDLNHVHTHDLRRRIGVVLQDFHIFSGSIHDNIALGNPSITRERAIEAAKTVNAHGFISALPQGYDTPLAERGGNLSQGQRQLLAFARVLAADPEILVLDEATASIDTETELLIQDALRKLTAGRTSILIAHRLQTIQEADRVCVLHHGRVAEIGTHEELLALKGLYHTLHTLQFQDDGGGDPVGDDAPAAGHGPAARS